MNITKRNHYNPCFWTALWNPDYFAAHVASVSATRPARAHSVFALNVRSATIYPTTVERVHFDKNLGIAEITPESMKDFCSWRYPAAYKGLAQYVDEHPDTLYVDFESTLKGLEDKARYDDLLHAARIGGFTSTEHKGFVTCILIIHAMRSHEMMASMLDLSASVEMEKWEYFWLLKNAWANRFVLARAAMPMAAGQWILYRTAEHRFPLCDSPVMINRDTVMAVLSPRLLVEINLNLLGSEDSWSIRDGISASKFREFRRRSILNSFKEIIFSETAELERWRDLPEFRQRVRSLADRDSERRVIADGADRVIWALTGFGRVPAEFESWMERMPARGCAIR